MNWYFQTAAILMTVIGLVHSVLGERLIFRRMRAGGVIPTEGGNILREPHVRILWATWHLATVLGIGIAALLFWLALPFSAQPGRSPVAVAAIVSTLASSGLVLVATKGRHPGWVGLLGVALLAAAGASA